MDLVDLNKHDLGEWGTNLSRDPYGSRGSKSSSILLFKTERSRDPYGSRGSK